MHVIWFIFIQVIFIFYCYNCDKTAEDKECIRNEVTKKLCDSTFQDFTKKICMLMPDNPGKFKEKGSQLGIANECCDNTCGPSKLSELCLDEVEDGTWCQFIRDARDHVFLNTHNVIKKDDENKN
ncbi:uncharacterized protein LOC114343010 [Diabrotica virgifera virgifera]|uniref:Uncharacterized protein n=1 Tax=Diabrotica virgifera virgifera TaxID=50390 RepID=A0ABM5IYM0_DIAVI|nr:uncharacterized protein LOC114343010 [Diabrotica virgifera virgifera]